MTLLAGVAPGDAQTRVEPEPRTTVVPKPPDPCCEPGQTYESPTERVGRSPVDWDCWPGWLLLLALAAPLFYLIGRNTAPPPPASADVIKAIEAVFNEQKRLGAVYNFAKLDPVLDEARMAVLAALRKLKVVS